MCVNQSCQNGQVGSRVVSGTMREPNGDTEGELRCRDRSRMFERVLDIYEWRHDIIVVHVNVVLFDGVVVWHWFVIDFYRVATPFSKVSACEARPFKGSVNNTDGLNMREIISPRYDTTFLLISYSETSNDAWGSTICDQCVLAMQVVLREMSEPRLT